MIIEPERSGKTISDVCVAFWSFERNMVQMEETI